MSILKSDSVSVSHIIICKGVSVILQVLEFTFFFPSSNESHSAPVAVRTVSGRYVGKVKQNKFWDLLFI